MVQKIGGKAIEIFFDSRLVVGQVWGELEARDPKMQEYLNQVRHLQSAFESFNLSQIPKSRNTHAKFLAMLATSSAQSLSQVILIEDLCKPTEVGRNVAHIHQIRVDLARSTLQYCSLRRISYLRRSQRLTRCEENLFSFSYPRTKNSIRDIFLAHICYAYTLKQLSYSQKSYMKEFVEATQGVDLCLTGPSLKAIGGQICRRKHKSM